MVGPGFKSPGYKIVTGRIIIPAALTIVLFVTAIFMFILHMLDTFLMDGKGEGILRLTESVCSVFELCHGQEQQGRMTKEQAQAEFIDLVFERNRYHLPRCRKICNPHTRKVASVIHFSAPCIWKTLRPGTVFVQALY